MKIVDIVSPSFRIISDKSVHAIDQEMRGLILEGWYPIGDVNKKGTEWIQVVVRETKEVL